jgi:ATP-dependent DNA ligase
MDLRGERLDNRRAKLCQLVVRAEGIQFSGHHAGDGKVVFGHACKLGASKAS